RSGRWRQSAAARDCVESRFFENAVEQNQWFAKSARSKNGVLTQSGALFGADGAGLRRLQQFLNPCTRQSYGVLCLQTAGSTCRNFLVGRGAQSPVDGC